MAQRSNSYKNKTTLYFTTPVIEKMYEELKESRGDFSYRLGDIVNYYDIIVRNTEIPPFNTEEMEAIGNMLSGSIISNTAIKFLPDFLEDALAMGYNYGVQDFHALVSKVRELTIVQRVVLVDNALRCKA